MLYEICSNLHNFFEVSRVSGDFTISNRTLTASFLQSGQYYRIIGSVFNDGIYKYGTDRLNADETFKGTVCALAIPKEFLDLVSEISEWQEKYGKADAGFQSESFGGYTYSKALNADGSQKTWKDAFKGRLRVWRKI